MADECASLITFLATPGPSFEIIGLHALCKLITDRAHFGGRLQFHESAVER
jgi:hypothetical protein